ncbi:MAG: THUMP domain-containing class I SAM-dependent RNA methyltransferase [Pseudanabaenaceae cyanobacterium]
MPFNRGFATTARGLETLTAQELADLGAQNVAPGFCGVHFWGDRPTLYRLNLWARLPFRILDWVGEIPARDRQELYDAVQTIDWEPWLPPDRTLAVRATGKSPTLNHTHFTALQVKNGIVAWQETHWGRRSAVNTEDPDVQIEVYIEGDTATLWRDSSGRSLHRRGYRPAVGAAPLKESLAAALLRLAQWDGQTAFCDPLCGAGTLPLEAAAIAFNRAPGLYRDRFGFFTWPDFDRPLWQQLRQEAVQHQKSTLAFPIVGSDRDGEAIARANHNAHQSGLGPPLRFVQLDLQDVVAPAPQGILMCNPPYGVRIGRDRDLAEFYRTLGQVLKQQFRGWTAYILSGNKVLGATLGLKSCQRWPVWNGTLPCQLLKYELF